MAVLFKTAACLRFFGDDLVPEKVTELLGFVPDTGFTKGTVQKLPSGRERIHKSGSWRLKVEDREPGDLDAQILEILSKLSFNLEV